MSAQWQLDYLGLVMTQRNWSVADVARHAGVHHSTIARQVNGSATTALSLQTLDKIAAGSGIDYAPFNPGFADSERAAFRSVARQVLENLDKPAEAPPPERINEIQYSMVDGRFKVAAVLDKAGFAKLRRLLDAIEPTLDD